MKLAAPVAELSSVRSPSSPLPQPPRVFEITQASENSFDAFVGIQRGLIMVFLLFDRKDLKNLVISVAIFGRGA